MNNPRIYWTSIEYEYPKDSSESGKLAGGFVYGFVEAWDQKEALNKFTNKLKQQGIEVKAVESISLYDIKMEWETEEQTNNAMQLYKQAQSSSEAIFDTYYAYERDK